MHTTDIEGLIVRRATIKDCDAMMELIHELAVYEKAPDEVTVTPEHFRESGFGPNPVWWAFVAEVQEKIVGFALYYVRYSTWKGSRMYLEDIIVTEDYRRHGIGSLMMDVLMAEAKDRKFHGITWQVLEWNTPAIRFYEQYKAKFDPEWINVSVTF